MFSHIKNLVKRNITLPPTGVNGNLDGMNQSIWEMECWKQLLPVATNDDATKNRTTLSDTKSTAWTVRIFM